MLVYIFPTSMHLGGASYPLPRCRHELAIIGGWSINADGRLSSECIRGGQTAHTRVHSGHVSAFGDRVKAWIRPGIILLVLPITTRATGPPSLQVYWHLEVIAVFYLGLWYETQWSLSATPEHSLHTRRLVPILSPKYRTWKCTMLSQRRNNNHGRDLKPSILPASCPSTPNNQAALALPCRRSHILGSRFCRSHRQHQRKISRSCSAGIRDRSSSELLAGPDERLVPAESLTV
jgi:hypothetical protein